MSFASLFAEDFVEKMAVLASDAFGLMPTGYTSREEGHFVEHIRTKLSPRTHQNSLSIYSSKSLLSS